LAELSAGERRTQQRAAILAAIREAPGPLTVREILEHASRDAPSLGQATVYRNLKMLTDAGEVRCITLPDGQNRYESANLPHHHHFRCRQCERTFDLPGCAVGVPDGATLPGGFHVESHEVTFYGLCPECS
jgi:Fur family ferric uptake transcriptional regulator